MGDICAKEACFRLALFFYIDEDSPESIHAMTSAKCDLPAARTYKKIKRDENPKGPDHNPRCSSIFQYPSASFDWDGIYIT